MSIEFEHAMLQKENEWMKQEKNIAAIRQLGMQEYARRILDIQKAFEGKDHTLCCMDEGTPMGDMRSAGSGILTEGDERDTFFASLKQAGVESVTSHAGCGAAALYKERHEITDKTVDEVAIEQAKLIAQKLGAKYEGHISDLKRPQEFHSARVVYLDGTGKFNPSKVINLPSGFVVSRRFMSSKQALAEVQLASQIAFGDHGFGKKFTPDHPLMVIAIGDSENDAYSTSQLQSELAALKKQLDQTAPENSARIQFDQWEQPTAEIFQRAA